MVVGGSDIGAVGEVDDIVVGALALERPVVALEIAIDGLFAAPRRDRQFRPPSRFPASTIDLAFALADSVPAAAVEATVRGAVGVLLEDVHVFDEFRSDAVGAGRRSLAFALCFRAPDRTLTDAEVGDLRQRAIDAVTSDHDAQLR